jgi:hypothetical protein
MPSCSSHYSCRRPTELKDGTFVNVERQTVVGVVEDARYRGIQNSRSDVYLPYGQAPAAL